MLFWAVNNIVTLDAIEDPYEITGDFIQTAGVGPNAEVTYIGVNYGRVGAVERTAEGVSITMKIDTGKLLPAGSVARGFRKSAIGEPYINFVPPYDHEKEHPAHHHADTAPTTHTTPP